MTPSAPLHRPTPPPAGLLVHHTDGGVKLTRSWRNMASWALLPLALVSAWGAFEIYKIVKGEPWDSWLWWIVGTAVGIAAALACWVTLRLINVTRLEADPERITVMHGPLPWWRGFTLAAQTVRQIEVRTRHGHYDGRRTTYYGLWAIHADRSEICLMERDIDREQAQFVRAEVSRVLRLGERG